MTRYGCHSETSGPGPRSAAQTLSVQDGWTPDGRRVMRTYRPTWLPIKCGHIAQAGKGSDPLCAGCENRGF